ncbi:MAG: DUF5711 family protein [Lachnospiraceae bacterium]|nr:DUF5711 family protein [Lachnospiraceae bacterium]
MSEEVNEYFLKKYEANDKEFKSKLARHRRLVLYRIIAVVVIVLLCVLFSYKSYKDRVYTDYSITKTTEYEEAASANYRGFNGNVLRYSRDGATAFNMNDDMLWNQTYEMQNPMADICGDYIALGDYRGTKIYVLNSEGLKGEIDTTIPIQRFCVSGNGNVAVVLEDDEVTWVRLYNKEGENVANDRTTMSKSGYPITMDISEDGILLNVSYLYVGNGKVSSSVAFYNFGSVGQNEIDNLVSGYNYDDETITYVQFMNQNTAFAVGNSRFEIYSGNQKPENTFEAIIEDEIQSVYYNENYIGLVYKDISKELPYHIDVYNTSGNIVNSQDFDLDYTDIIFNKDLMIIYDATECIMYNMDGLVKYKGLLKNSIIRMIPTNNKTKYLFVSGTKMDEIQLK